MTVRKVSIIDKYCGLSSDTKPTPNFPLAEFYETDTGWLWLWDGDEWVQDMRLINALSEALTSILASDLLS